MEQAALAMRIENSTSLLAITSSKKILLFKTMSALIIFPQGTI
jgi:hypothetical protein